jgi:hypothetical protein
MDKDLQDFLDAIGRRDLDLDLSTDQIRELRREMKRLASAARLTHSIADRPHRTDLYPSLSAELRDVVNSPAFEILDSTGVAEALDEHGPLIFARLRPDDVPPEDADFLRKCGIKEPEAEVTIALARLRAGYWMIGSQPTRRTGVSELMASSKGKLWEAAHQLESSDGEAESGGPQAKPKKYFTGIGKILSGVVAGTGNVLVGAGAIPASGGAVIAGVIASSSFAVGMVMQGIGDLRGE